MQHIPYCNGYLMYKTRPPSDERFTSEASMNVPTFRRFRILLRLRRPHEASSRPLGRPSPDDIEAGRYGSGRSKRNGLLRVDKTPACGSAHARSELESWTGTTTATVLPRGAHQSKCSSQEKYLGPAIIRSGVRFLQWTDRRSFVF